MRLENIGFYTLSNERAEKANLFTSLKRCELILTDQCNFHCPYCRGLSGKAEGTIGVHEALQLIKLWASDHLENVRFSGGEPTQYSKSGLFNIVQACRDYGVRRIALSTNGSADLGYYRDLVHAGVNDFSISLDACCSNVGNKMTGNSFSWHRTIDNIRELSKETYVSVGLVFTEGNIHDCINTVIFAHDLGVSDIRVIPSAQYNKALSKLTDLPKEILEKYPILKYRIENVRKGRHVRGLEEKHRYLKCWIMLDDMAVARNYHFPCIIYLREGGDPIGKVGPHMRSVRLKFIKRHNPYEDPIFKKYCLDVCLDYNIVAQRTHKIINKRLYILGE